MAKRWVRSLWGWAALLVQVTPKDRKNRGSTAIPNRVLAVPGGRLTDLRPMRSNVDDLFQAVDTDEDNTINLEELLGRRADSDRGITLRHGQSMFKPKPT